VVKTDSEGNVYVVWEDVIKKRSVFEMARSSDGGATVAKPTVVANVTDVGTFDGVRLISFDGIAAARTGRSRGSASPTAPRAASARRT
jgi:hypothetical protein